MTGREIPQPVQFAVVDLCLAAEAVNQRAVDVVVCRDTVVVQLVEVEDTIQIRSHLTGIRVGGSFLGKDAPIDALHGDAGAEILSSDVGFHAKRILEVGILRIEQLERFVGAVIGKRAMIFIFSIQ